MTICPAAGSCSGSASPGPQVVEGWYGQPFAKPLARMREYIEILRAIWARQGPVTNDGPHYPLPYPGGTGLGKPLKSSIHPLRTEIPIYLAAEGPRNIALGGELCDGWLALFYSPHHDDYYREALTEGLNRPGARSTPEAFDVVAQVPLIVTDDEDAALDAVRPFYALYFGGMGAKQVNFHANVPIRMGYEREIERVQELYLAARRLDAAAALPRALLEQLTLIGSPREDPPRPRGLARLARDDAADRRRSGDAAHRRRARARLTAATRRSPGSSSPARRPCTSARRPTADPGR